MTHPRFAVVFLAAVGIAAAPACKAAKPRPVTPGEIEAHIRFLSDDLLEGRGLGSRGLALAALYQASYLQSLGLEPVFDGGFRQPFDVKGVMPDGEASLEVFGDGGTLTPRRLDDFVIGTFREDAPEGVEGEIVYAGYLIQAPERSWDDIKGADLRGKVLLVEINEPENRPGGLFDGEEMTYYGRWTSKFERAAALGATGCLIIHDTKGAAYGWGVVRNGWAVEQYVLPDVEQKLFFRGWLTGETAERVFALAGRSRTELRAEAETSAFAPVPLGLSARVRQKPAFRSVPTENVAARLRGRGRGHRRGTVILSAHFDHLGRDETLAGDQVYNGAVDNCSASATMLALARYFAERPERLRVDLLFAAVTGEENLFLGSDHFVRHLPVPKASVLANINFEMTNVWGETEDVFGIGAKHSDLDEILAQAARNLKLTYTPERYGELGFFFRSDQFSFARGGIPAVWLHHGVVSRGEDKGRAARAFADYQATKYHKVTDEIGPDWDLGGAVQIARWAEEIVRLLGERPAPPDFRPSSPFRRAGEE
ncbi:MAG: M28 family peptidase [Candidatus Aminicenantes bacterium]|nr:M28 family peptidase [Candidatus Aminicenantes bacterium]